MKKLISLFLIVTILISLISIGVSPVSAASNVNQNNYYKYKETFLKNNCFSSELFDVLNLPYRANVEKLENDTAFKTEWVVWEAATINFSDAIDDISGTNQCKYYEGILLDIIVKNSQDDNFISTIKEYKDMFGISVIKKQESLLLKI